MRGYVRFILAVMLVTVAAVGNARGEEREWKKYNDGNITWLYQMVRGNGCSIKPASYRFGTPTLTIPSRVMEGGRSIRVLEIERYAFDDCKTLTSVVIPEGVTTIGERAFNACVNLREVSIPSSVTTILLYAFRDCSGLTSVVIPSSMTTIGEGIFDGCSSLTSVTIPEGVTTIEYGPFSGCSGLTSVVIPSSVTKIGISAFSGCSGLTSVVIPSSVTTIGSSAFSGCSRLERIAVASGNSHYYEDGGVLFGLEYDYGIGKEGKVLKYYPAWRTGEYRIPSDVEIIGASAFAGCSGLTSVTIPKGVTAIDGGAFWGCSGLTSVTIPEGVTTIGGGAFEGCSGLTSVTIPEGVTKIGWEAFDSCVNLSEVSIPSSVTSIDRVIFLGCSRLQRIKVAPGNPRYHVEDGVLYELEHDVMTGKDVKVLKFYPSGRAGEYKFPRDVAKVETDAFSGCSKLTKVYIPENIELRSFDCFYDCIALEEIVVESHDEGARYYTKDGVLFSRYDSEGKKELTLVCCPRGKRGAYEIPYGVEAIAEGAFAGCSQLTDITIPTGVRKFGDIAFEGCSGLTRLTIPATVEDVGLSYSGTFTNLEEFVVDAANPSYCAKGGVLFSKDMRRLLYYPEGRKGDAYEVPQGVTIFIDLTYYASCYRSLTSVVIPSSVKELWGNAFYMCENLEEVYWLASADISSVGKAFYGISPEATLYVRPGEKQKVEAEEWAKRFSKIVEGYVVTFRDADGQPVGEQLVKPNGKARALDMQDKNGNAVVWLLNGAPYDFDLPVRGDLVLQAGGNSTAVESALLEGVQAVSNPVVDVLELRGMGDAARVEVYSVAGVQVHAGALQGEDRVQVDARGWASGVYVVRVVARDGAKTLRVVKRD